MYNPFKYNKSELDIGDIVKLNNDMFFILLKSPRGVIRLYDYDGWMDIKRYDEHLQFVDRCLNREYLFKWSVHSLYKPICNITIPKLLGEYQCNFSVSDLLSNYQLVNHSNNTFINLGIYVSDKCIL